MPYADPKDGLRWQRENREKRNVIVHRYKEKSNRKAFRDSDARHRYGFPDYQSMASFRQQACNICGQLAKKMCIDHHGPAGKFDGTYRGVLCQQCNVRLGWLETHLGKIREYMQRLPQCQR